MSDIANRLLDWDEPLTEAHRKAAAAELERLRAKLTEAAAFLDGMADRIEEESWGTGYSDEGKRDAADCRAMANKLRGQA